MRIQILLFDGFDELDALGPYEVLSAAAEAGADLRTEPVRVGSATVTSGFGLQLHVRTPLEPDHPPDLLLVPGAGWLADAEQGSWAERERERVAAAVGAVHARGAMVVAVGTGSTIAAAADLLRGRPAAADPRVDAALRVLGAEVVPVRVVDGGEVVTSGGLTSGVDLALWLVERFASTELARSVAERLGHERRGDVWRAGERAL
jgi:transcriptional regulator GlxA family with amidase domain